VLYASKMDEKFEGIAWRAPSVSEGGPILHEDSAAYAVCVTERAVAAGDRWVFIGPVRDGGVIADRAPLVYHRRGFVELAEPIG
jgi:flavin reductase (DIM6/NTAB) family NADH-FMN oxidoreductase RutF